MPGEPLLTTRGLTGGYGGKPVLQGVDFSLRPGEVVAVIGRNGVGKTTFMRALIGLVEASAGAITFAGEDVTAAPAEARARRGMGYIPQGREVFAGLSVRENLMVGETAVADRGAADTERILKFFPVLRERWRQSAETLSGGQQQQLAIARAMMGNPKILLLDEPSEGIQPSIVHDIARNVRALNAETGTSVLFVEQNLDLIVSLADRGFVMDKGRIVATLSPDEITERDAVRRHLSL